MDWLANGAWAMPSARLEWLAGDPWAIYHPHPTRNGALALGTFEGFHHSRSSTKTAPNRSNRQPAIADLAHPNFAGHPRTKANIMHDKFLVDVQRKRVPHGLPRISRPEAITTQANLLHVLTQRELARLYLGSLRSSRRRDP